MGSPNFPNIAISFNTASKCSKSVTSIMIYLINSLTHTTTLNATTKPWKRCGKTLISPLSESTTTTVATPPTNQNLPHSHLGRQLPQHDLPGLSRQTFCNKPLPTTMVTTLVPPPVPATPYGPSATVSPLPHPATALNLNSGSTMTSSTATR
ncbi:hypothetical protein TorRG33x02_189210 [Trema orientale]|uniref:Uncharacterized protein n=1 Tax=Trema orientale TaxID=63057 RepID=A0A2P5EIA4_TREOI|nr:hypothetical protein TorRG33x02_189210 [Trema orientale]